MDNVLRKYNASCMWVHGMCIDAANLIDVHFSFKCPIVNVPLQAASSQNTHQKTMLWFGGFTGVLWAGVRDHTS